MDPELAERRVFATPANVAVDAELSFALVDYSRRRAGVVSGERSFIHGLRDFSMRLLASASPHPWRAASPDELNTTFAAMAGIVVQTSDFRGVARVISEIRAIRDSRQHELPALIEADLEAGHWARNLPTATDAGFRELVMIDRRRARTQREQEGQVGWLEGTLRHRDRYIRELERIIESFEETLTYKTVQAIRAPRRIATEKAVESAKATARGSAPRRHVQSPAAGPARHEVLGLRTARTTTRSCTRSSRQETRPAGVSREPASTGPVRASSTMGVSVILATHSVAHHLGQTQEGSALPHRRAKAGGTGAPASSASTATRAELRGSQQTSRPSPTVLCAPPTHR